MLATGLAQAQTFPERPISLIVPHSAGGTSDIPARTVAADLADEGVRAAQLNGEAFSRFIQTEVSTWAVAVRDSGASL